MTNSHHPPPAGWRRTQNHSISEGCRKGGGRRNRSICEPSEGSEAFARCCLRVRVRGRVRDETYTKTLPTLPIVPYLEYYPYLIDAYQQSFAGMVSHQHFRTRKCWLIMRRRNNLSAPQSPVAWRGRYLLPRYARLLVGPAVGLAGSSSHNMWGRQVTAGWVQPAVEARHRWSICLFIGQIGDRSVERGALGQGRNGAIDRFYGAFGGNLPWP